MTACGIASGILMDDHCNVNYFWSAKMDNSVTVPKVL